MSEYRHVQYGLSIQVAHGPRIYGKVVRGGKTFYRRYKREQKNGFTSVNLLELQIKASERRMLEMCGVNEYIRG